MTFAATYAIFPIIGYEISMFELAPTMMILPWYLAVVTQHRLAMAGAYNATVLVGKIKVLPQMRSWVLHKNGIDRSD